jgi:alkyl hydroperoxide reductase subunit AhpC
VELEQNRDRIRRQGLGLAAVSYDSVAVLKSFAERRHIGFPLLSDASSQVIRRFGILNETVEPGNFAFGIPYPGTYVLDPRGIVVSKYFEDDYRERISASDILVRQFGEAASSAAGTVDAAQMRVSTGASASVARPQQRIVLTVELDLKPKMHLYAPGVAGYTPVEWKLEEGPFLKPHAFEYPPSTKLRLKVIRETVPVYRGRVRFTREVTFGPENTLRPRLSPSGELVLKGELRYQACDDRKCYTPETVPLAWRFQFEGLVRERAPADLQRKIP